MGVIRDDFGDPLGVCVMGKLQNRHDKPLQQLYDTTGSASVVYLDTSAISQAGFHTNKAEKVDNSSLQMNPDILKQVQETGTKSHVSYALSHREYILSCFPVLTSKAEKAGAACVGVPEQQALETRQVVETYGDRTKESVQFWLIGVGMVSLIGFGLFSLFLASGVIGPITKVTEGLTHSAQQITHAIRNVSRAAGQLSEGASSQAAAVEQMSSSLEETASISAQNANNAGSADKLMRKTGVAMESVAESMGNLTLSINAISTASLETQKIIKTIDEIAFQTNLLALNAAVEAARAGEAGAGFAVVASEVRNLALRAAEAAKSTEELIEGTVKRVQEGAELIGKTTTGFTEVQASVREAVELAGNIAVASHEQAQGIAQINTAVVEIDKVTQQNVANAEESTSAVFEVNLQAEEISGFVERLLTLVVGERNVPKHKTTCNHAVADDEQRLLDPPVNA